jgi:peptidoglycan/xylan/chitin deacetylase (PgdA/CDA1 family)
MVSKRRHHFRTIAILTYHSLDDSGSVISVHPRAFAEHMRILYESDVKVVPLRDVLKLINNGQSIEQMVAITFDDGFRNFYKHGLPVLQRYNFPATLFLVTDYCGKNNGWPSQRNSIVSRPLLSWAEVSEMSKDGVSFGSHTMSHPDLRRLPVREVEKELVASKKAIEDATSQPVEMFAYPYGYSNETVRVFTRTHFSLACSTTLGFVSPGSDLFALERLDMYYIRRPVMFRYLLSKEMNVYIRARRKLRRIREGIWESLEWR